MKKKTLLLSLFLGACAIGLAQDDDAYKTWMKSLPGSVGGMRKNLEAKSNDAAAADAKKVEAVFAQSAEYWTKKGVTDAAGWSKDAQTAAGKVAAAAAAGDTEGATTAL